MSQQLMDDFKRLFNLPEVLVPFIDMVASEDEMKLVVAMDGKDHNEDEICALMGWTPEQGKALIHKAHDKGIIHPMGRRGATPPFRYVSSTFYHRISPIGQYERWVDIPVDVRQEVLDWELAEWVKLWAPTIKETEVNPEAYRRMPNHDYLILEEALEMVDASDAWEVGVCDCRSLTQGCDRNTLVCIHLGEMAKMATARGKGKVLTKEECRELTIRCDKEGMMHTGDYRWRERGTGTGFCNCCTCCCFPMRGGLAFGLRKTFPRMHWVPVKDESKCLHCGTCVKRCYYHAHFYDGSTVVVNGKVTQHVTFDADKCWGCGLCATGCPSGALEMVPVETGLTRGEYASETAKRWYAEHAEKPALETAGAASPGTD